MHVSSSSLSRLLVVAASLAPSVALAQASLPDLTVEAVSLAPRTTGYWLEALVCHQGMSVSTAEVDFVASSDATVVSPRTSTASADLLLFSATAYLETDRCAIVSHYFEKSALSSLPAGPVSVGVAVDPRDRVLEADEANQSAVAELRLTLGSVDLSADVYRATFDSSGGIEVQGKVCSHGELVATSTVTVVDLYHASTTGLATAVSAGPSLSVATPPLGGCTHFSSTVSATGVSNYVLGRIAVTGDARGENDLDALPIERSTRPYVKSIHTRVRPGTTPSVVVGAEVCGGAHGVAIPTTLSFVATEDGTVESGPSYVTDALIGTLDVPELPIATCVTVELEQPSLPVPPSAGPVSAVAGFVGVTVSGRTTLSAPTHFGVAPDLALERVEPVGAQGVEVHVCNQGLVAAEIGQIAVTTVSGSLPRPLSRLGYAYPMTASVTGSLPPGLCETVSVQGPLPPPPGGDLRLVAQRDLPGTRPDAQPGNDVVFSELVSPDPAYVPSLSIRGVRRELVSTAGTLETRLIATVCAGGTGYGTFGVDFLATLDDEVERPASGHIYLDDTLLASVSMPALVGELGPWECIEVEALPGALPTASARGTRLAARIEPGNIYVDALTADDVVVGELLPSAGAAQLEFATAEVTPRGSRQFALSADVCNRGPATSSALSVSVYVDRSVRGHLVNTPFVSFGLPALPPTACAHLDESFDTWPVTEPLHVRLRAHEAGIAPRPAYDGVAAFGPFTYGPDLVFGAPQPRRLVQRHGGARVRYAAELCNRGGSGSLATSVRLVSSADAVFETPATGSYADTLFGTSPVPALLPGACVVLDTEADLIPSPARPDLATPDAFSVGMVLVDSDGRSGLVDFGPHLVGADLAVVSTFAETSLAMPGFIQTFELCNFGGLPSSGGLARIGSSHDAYLRGGYWNPHVEVSLPSVPARACTSITARLPSLAPVPGSGRVDYIPRLLVGLAPSQGYVFEPYGTPGWPLFDAGPQPADPWQNDLEVRAVRRRFDDEQGADHLFEAEVCATTNGPEGIVVDFILSPDATLERPVGGSYRQDVLLGTVNLPAQYRYPPGRCAWVALRTSVPTPSYPSGSSSLSYGWFGARARFVTAPVPLPDRAERVGGTVVFDGASDLAVTAAGLDAPRTLYFAEVCNEGRAPSGTHSVQLFARLAGIESVIATLPLGPVPAGRCRRVETPASPGLVPYTVGARLTPRDGNPENDLFVAAHEASTTAYPSFSVASVEVFPAARRIEVRACNEGFIAGTLPDIGLGIVGAPVSWAASTPIGIIAASGLSLQPGDCATVEYGYASLPQASIASPSRQLSEGYVRAEIDPAGLVREAREDDDVGLSAVVGTGPGANLVVTRMERRFELHLWPLTPEFEFFDVEVCNVGDASAPASSVGLLADESPDLWAVVESGAHVFVTEAPIPALDAGACATQSMSMGFLPSFLPGNPSSVWLGAVADSRREMGESSERDNLRAFERPHSSGSVPDAELVSAQHRWDPTPRTGAEHVFTLEVCGAYSTPIAAIEVVASADPEIEDGFHLPFDRDLPIFTAQPAGGIAFSEPGCKTIELRVPQAALGSFGTLPSGSIYFGVRLDPTRSLVGSYRGDDLVVVGPWRSGPALTRLERASGLTLGIELDVEICQSDVGPLSGGTLQLTASRSETRDDGIALGSPIALPTLGAGRCTELRVPVGVIPGFSGGSSTAPAYIHASVSDGSVITDTRALGPFGTGSGPDLAVVSTSVAVIPESSPLERRFEARVCNQGTASASFDAALLASSDPLFGGPTDVTLQTYTATSALAAGACIDISLRQGAVAQLTGSYGPVWVALELRSPSDRDSSNDVGVFGTLAPDAGADLAVRAFTPPRPYGNIGMSRAEVLVCNEGFTAITDYHVEISIGAEPSPSTMRILSSGTYNRTEDALAPGACRNHEFTTGGYYPGSVDEVWMLARATTNDLNPSNDVVTLRWAERSAGVDLVVTALDAPRSAQGSFTATIRVCNHGSALGSSPVDVELLASADPVLERALSLGARPNDLVLGTGTVPALQPNVCADVTVNASAPAAGTWYLGAEVNPSGPQVEDSYANNRFLGGRIGIGAGPDLVIGLFEGPFMAPTTSFDAELYVCNEGTASAPASSVAIYASTDGSFDAQDALLATGTVPPLGADACDYVVATTPIPAVAGAYHLVAVLDPAQTLFELREDNNQAVAGPFAFGAGPDLNFISIDAASSMVDAVEALGTICNFGNAASAPQLVAFYFGPDAYLDPASDHLFGQDLLPAIEPGSCHSLVASGSAPNWPSGQYFITGLVDPNLTATDLDRSNNLAVEGPIGMGLIGNLRPIEIEAPENVNGAFDARITVCNDGREMVPSSSLTLFRTTAAQPDTSSPSFSTDEYLGYATIPVLDADVCTKVYVPGWSMGATPLIGRIGVMIDEMGAVRELFEDDNVLFGSPTGFGPWVDLEVTALAAPSGIEGTLTSTVQVCNGGTSPSVATTVELHALEGIEGELGASSLVGSSSVRGLGAGECVGFPVTGTLPSGLGTTVHLVARVDPTNAISESFEADNRHVAGPFGSGAGPSLVVDALSGPTAAPLASTFTVTATVCNSGTRASAASTVGIYATDDDFVVPDRSGAGPDPFLGSGAVPALAAGACAPVSVTATAQQEGLWGLGAYVDDTGALTELVEIDNDRVVRPFAIGSGPELIITEVSPSRFGEGLMSYSVRVCNVGDAAAGTNYLDVFTSDDDRIDTLFGLDPKVVERVVVPALAAGQCTDITGSEWTREIPAPLPPTFQWRIGAKVDTQEQVPQLIFDNDAYLR